MLIILALEEKYGIQEAHRPVILVNWRTQRLVTDLVSKNKVESTIQNAEHKWLWGAKPQKGHL